MHSVPRRATRRAASTQAFFVVFLASALCLAGCAHRVEGRVVAGDASFVTVVSADDPRLSAPGIGGVRISFTRDPLRLNRELVASGVSGPEGEISIPIDAVGAGWLEEQWLVQAVRSDRGAAEGLLSLPRGDRRLLIMLAPGHPSEIRALERSWRESGAALREEAGRWSR